MALKKTKKKTTNSKPSKKTAQKLGGLFIQKRVDKRGRKYFIDREGQRRKGVEYSSQWKKGGGRVSRKVYDQTIGAVREFEIDDIEEAHLIAKDYFVLEKAGKQRKREIEILAGEFTGQILFYRATDTVKEADDAGAIIKILKPTGSNFKKYDVVQAMDIAHKFIDAVSDAIEEAKKAAKVANEELLSPMIYFRFQHNIKENTFYIDFKNLIGIDQYVFMLQLIKDNFASYE